MPASELTITKLQLNTPVYAQRNAPTNPSIPPQKYELAGYLRFVYAESEPPYKVNSFILDRGDLGASVIVPIANVAEYHEGQECHPNRRSKEVQEGEAGQRLILTLSNEEVAQLPEYVAPTHHHNVREYREAGGYKRPNNRRPNNRRPFNNRRNLQDR